MWRKENSYTPLLGMYISAAIMENNMEIPLKARNKTSIWSRNPSIGYIFIIHELVLSNKYLFYHVYGNVVCNSQNVESTMMSIIKWIDKENVVFIHSGIQLSHKKNEILSFEEIWLELEPITWSEVSQTLKDKYPMFFLICGI